MSRLILLLILLSSVLGSPAPRVGAVVGLGYVGCDVIDECSPGGYRPRERFPYKIHTFPKAAKAAKGKFFFVPCAGARPGRCNVRYTRKRLIRYGRIWH